MRRDGEQNKSQWSTISRLSNLHLTGHFSRQRWRQPTLATFALSHTEAVCETSCKEIHSNFEQLGMAAEASVDRGATLLHCIKLFSTRQWKWRPLIINCLDDQLCDRWKVVTDGDSASGARKWFKKTALSFLFLYFFVTTTLQRLFRKPNAYARNAIKLASGHFSGTVVITEWQKKKKRWANNNGC